MLSGAQKTTREIEIETFVTHRFWRNYREGFEVATWGGQGRVQTMRAIGHGAHALLGSVNGVFGASLAKAELFS